MNRKSASIAVLFIVCATSIVLQMRGTAPAQPADPPQQPPADIAPIQTPQAFDQPQPGLQLIETNNYIRGPQTRTDFNVSGAGLTVAVLDTGLRVTHVDFTGRVPAQRNFTLDNGGDVNNANDGNGHGTNVAGIIASNQLHVGIAPGANVIPLKVLSNTGGGTFDSINDALQWVIDNRINHKITVVNMSLGSNSNHQNDTFGMDRIQDKIRMLRQAKVAVVVSAGNGFFNHMSQEGMGYPGIFRETVSVGAVYDANEGPFSYQSGAIANTTDAGRFTPFSQRLHESTNSDCRTDIFAPGAPVTSSGHLSDNGESIQHGTSQAAPVTAGVVLLMQQYHLRQTGTLPSVEDIEVWLRRGAHYELDGDDEDDNVTNTNKAYPQLDAYEALSSITRSIQKNLLEKGAASPFSLKQ